MLLSEALNLASTLVALSRNFNNLLKTGSCFNQRGSNFLAKAQPREGGLRKNESLSV